MSKLDGKFLVITERGAVVREIPAGPLDAMQKAVGGWIELFLRMESKSRTNIGIDFYCNEEGRLNGMEPNAIVDARDGHLFDIMGPVLITASNDDGETLGLTDDEIKAVAVTFPARFAPFPSVTYNG